MFSASPIAVRAGSPVDSQIKICFFTHSGTHLSYNMDVGAIAQFAGITGASDQIAAQYLRLAEGNFEQAIELFFANEGADLGPSSESAQHLNDPPSLAQPPARPTRHRRGYEDQDGIVHIDSDEEDNAYADDGIEVTGEITRQTPAARTPYQPSMSSGNNTSSASRAGAAVDDDELMARRLQEEFYSAAGQANNTHTANLEALDEYGYRAPLGRTTETLVGPGSFDPTNAEEMRVAVMEQMLARRQHPRTRGKVQRQARKMVDSYDPNKYRAAWDFQPSNCVLDME